MSELGKVKPIWFTECGIPMNDPPVSGFEDGGQPVNGATKYVRRNFYYNKAQRIEDQLRTENLVR